MFSVVAQLSYNLHTNLLFVLKVSMVESMGCFCLLKTKQKISFPSLFLVAVPVTLEIILYEDTVTSLSLAELLSDNHEITPTQLNAILNNR